MNEKYHADTVKLNITHSYSNMLEVIEKNEFVVDIARKAIKNAGLEPISRPVRGGTDGASGCGLYHGKPQHAFECRRERHHGADWQRNQQRYCGRDGHVQPLYGVERRRRRSACG